MVDNETYYVTAQDQKKVIGPVTPTQITAALEQGRLKPKHLVSHSPEGPWQTLEVVFASASNQSPSLGKQKKPTKQSQATKGHVTAPPKDRAELKKWLQANKDQSSVSCPHCSASVKHRNLLQHCDKLHFHSTSAVSSPASAVSSPAGWRVRGPKQRLLESLLTIAIVIAVVSAGAWGLWILGESLWGFATHGTESLWGFATQYWDSSGAFRVLTVCVGVAVTIWLAVTLGMAGVVIILELMWTGFCCWGLYVMVAGMEPEGTLQWLRTFAALGFAFFFLGGGFLGVAAGFGAGELIWLILPPMLIGFLSFAIGGIGATVLWLYSG